MDIHRYTLAELSQQLACGACSSVEITQAFLKRIEQLQPTLNALVHCDPELALTQARNADHKRAKGQATPLTGIPIIHKDLFCTKTMPTTCCSKMLAGYQPPYDAAVVEYLANDMMVTLGKANMDEFAMGSSNESSYFGAVRNPWDLNKVPGGSSGGSAVAIAAGLAPAATGSDTGGSIRQPAALCGVTGLKPTYGRVSRFGMIAFASSLDQAGPLAKTAEDCAILLQAMAKVDPRDASSDKRPAPSYRQKLNQTNLKGLRIGIPHAFLDDRLDAEVADALQQLIAFYRQEGASIVFLDMPLLELAIPCYYVIACAEASSNLARYDGVRFGYRSSQAKQLSELYRNSRGEAFGIEVKRRILLGTYVLSTGYYDAYFNLAKRIRQMISQQFRSIWQQCDLILGPTTPTVAFDLASKINDPLRMYLSDFYTVSSNLAGLPALSMPIGFNRQKLPIGAQLIGPCWQEASILSVAHQYQLQTKWHLHQPDLKTSSENHLAREDIAQ